MPPEAKPNEAMTGVIGLFIYEVKSECLAPDLSDQKVAVFIYTVTKAVGKPWSTLPEQQVLTGKGRTLSHWEVLADEPPEFATYHSGDKTIHIRAKKLPLHEDALRGKNGKGKAASKGAESRFRSKSRGQERLQAPDPGTTPPQKRSFPTVRLFESRKEELQDEQELEPERRPPWRKDPITQEAMEVHVALAASLAEAKTKKSHLEQPQKRRQELDHPHPKLERLLELLSLHRVQYGTLSLTRRSW